MDKDKTIFLDLIKFIKQKNVFLRNVVIFFLLFGLFKIFISEDLYKSKITLYPAGELNESSNLLSQYNDYMQLMGISSSDNNFYIPDIIESNSLKKEIIYKNWNNFKYKVPMNLIDYWKIDDSSIYNKIKRIFGGSFYNKNLYEKNAAISRLNNLIEINENNSGLIEVTVFMNEPKMASDIANYIAEYVVDFVKKQQLIFANKSKDFILERKQIAHEELSDSEVDITNFRKKHPLILDTPELQLERARLIRNVQVNQEVYITLREQLEIAKIETTKERLFINVLDKAEPDYKKAKPKILLTLIVFIFFGFIFAILLLLLYFNYEKYKSKYNF